MIVDTEVAIDYSDALSKLEEINVPVGQTIFRRHFHVWWLHVEDVILILIRWTTPEVNLDEVLGFEEFKEAQQDCSVDCRSVR